MRREDIDLVYASGRDAVVALIAAQAARASTSWPC